MQLFSPTAKDFYKSDHKSQYPKGLTLGYANYTPRSGNHRNVPGDKVVFVGLQLFIKDFLINDWNETFFIKNKEEVCKKYLRRITNSVGPINITHIEDLHDLGYLPIKIKALPEGSVIKYGIPPFTIMNTHSNFGWLPNMLESVLSAEIWPIMTSATTYNEYRKLFETYSMKTVGNIVFVPFQGHDFSFRGMPGRVAAAMTGFGALAAGSCGTDTIPAIDIAEDFYNADSDKEIVGFSVSATEHSVMSANISKYENDIKEGKYENDNIRLEFNNDKLFAEYLTVKYLITEVYPNGIISIVCDTFDFWSLVTKILPKLKTEILNRDGKVVIRPDSGDPIRIMAGYEEHEILRTPDGIFYFEKGKNRQLLTEYEVKGLVNCLWDIFGGTESNKGYNVLDDHIGAIYGDSITYHRAEEILARLSRKNLASTNVILGIGSFTYQYVTRDTHGMAMKATYIEVDNEGINIFKDPKTDDGTKKSAKGLLKIIQNNKEFELIDQVSKKEESEGALELVFENGKLIKNQSLNEIRKLVKTFD